MRPDLTVILNYKAGNTYGLNIVLAALETQLPWAGLKVICAETHQELLSAMGSATEHSRLVLVAWSLRSLEFEGATRELAVLKKRFPGNQVLHAAGGVHATARPEETLRKGFDLVALGEGERTFIALLRGLAQGRELEEVPGIALLRKGRLIVNAPCPAVELNEFPPFALKHKRFNPIEITRGCPYACKFCQTAYMFHERYRHRTVANVCHYAGELKALGLTDIRFISPSALAYGARDKQVHLEKVEELLAGVRGILGSKGRIFFGTFPSELRPEQVSPEALRILKKYVANTNLVIGAQSGSDRLLRAVHRGHSVEEILAAVRLSREAGFVPNVDFIFGLPGETRRDLEATFKVIDRLTGWGARIHAHSFLPLPGTPFEEQTPVPMSPNNLRRLGALTAAGKVYGQWKHQLAWREKLGEKAE